ncbi:MAG: DUF2712 domain-containing protein [Clostridiales bacterium]|nr:DUF2712 domain-containing protein [Clostridiales bacterium]
MTVKNYNKKLMFTILALIVITTISLSGLVAYAYSDNNISYSFTIRASQAVSKYSEDEFRNTYNNDNAWKVNLRSSGEGSSTITYFRLCLEDNSGVSSWHSVVQGSGSHYYSAWDGADHTHVYLQGKNNNNTTKTYTVSGYWDEETGISPD